MHNISMKEPNVNENKMISNEFTSFETILITPIDTSASYNNVIGLTTISFPNFTVSKFGGPNPGSSVTFSYLVIGY